MNSHQLSTWTSNITNQMVLTLAVTLVAFNNLDALFTLMLISNHNGIEVNPIMKLVIDQGWIHFLLFKSIAIAIGVVTLVACRDIKVFGFITGKQLLAIVTVWYAMLMVYEYNLIS